MADPTPAEEWAAVAAEREPGATPPAPVVADPAPAPAAEPTTPAATNVQVDDPYKGLSADVKAKLERFDQLVVEHPKLLQALKETQGRVSALQSEFAKRQAPAAEPTTRQVAQAAQDPEKWATLKKDFPEWGEGISAFVEARLGALAGSGMTAEQIEQRVATQGSTLATQMNERFERMVLDVKYPDWDDEVKTPAFEAWFKAQKPEVQALANSPKGRDALKMLDAYHEAKKTPKVRDQRAATLAAAATSKPGSKPAAPKAFEDMSPKEQWDFLAEKRLRDTAAANA